MFWDMAEDETDSLTELLQNPNADLKDVLNEGKMLQEFRTGNEDIINYFTRENVIRELCIWSMTLSHEEDSNFMNLSRLSTEVLVCGGASYAKTLCMSTELKKFFNEFLSNDKDEWDSFCVGHFQKVFLNLLKQGIAPKEFLNEFPSIQENLAKHLSVIAVDEFVIFLELEYGESFDFINIIVEYINKEEGDLFNLLYALRQIFERGWESKEFIRNKFQSNEIIGKLINASKNIKNNLISIEILRLLARLREKSSKINEIMNEHSNEFIVNGLPEKAHESFLMANANLDNKTIINLLCNDIHWSILPKLGNLLNKLRSLPKDEFITAVKQSDLINKIIHDINSGELKPQQLLLIKIIYNCDQTLLEGINKDIISKALILETSYGGELPIGSEEVKVNAE